MGKKKSVVKVSGGTKGSLVVTPASVFIICELPDFTGIEISCGAGHVSKCTITGFLTGITGGGFSVSFFIEVLSCGDLFWEHDEIMKRKISNEKN